MDQFLIVIIAVEHIGSTLQWFCFDLCGFAVGANLCVRPIGGKYLDRHDAYIDTLEVGFMSTSLLGAAYLPKKIAHHCILFML